MFLFYHRPVGSQNKDIFKDKCINPLIEDQVKGVKGIDDLEIVKNKVVMPQNKKDPKQKHIK